MWPCLSGHPYYARSTHHRVVVVLRPISQKQLRTRGILQHRRASSLWACHNSRYAQLHSCPSQESRSAQRGPHRCPSASRRPLGARVRPARATEEDEEEECSLPPPPALDAMAPFPPPALGHAAAPLWPWCDGPAPLLEAAPGPPQWLGLALGLRSGAPSPPCGGRPEADAWRALPAASSPGQSRSRSL